MCPPMSADRLQTGNWFELVVESTPNAILVADSNRRITMVNRNTEILFGYARAELIGQQLEILVPERYRTGHPGHVASFFAAPKARSMGAGRDLFGLRRTAWRCPSKLA